MDTNTKDYITLNGEGAIRATYHNKGAFNMFGTYTVDHGTYGITIQNIIKKNFTFNRGGTIVFGGDPYQAALNLQAVYTVNGVSLSDLNIGNSFSSNTIRVNCLMNIGGQPAAPQVDFDLEDGKVHNLSFVSGCNGNLKAIGKLCEGQDKDYLIAVLKGNDCGGRGTSCADQLAIAIEAALKKESSL
jgi:uncharacterized protein (TIGR03905 family)